MQPVPTSIVERFAKLFVYGRVGYSLRDLEQLFVRYEVDAPSPSPSLPPTKSTYFAQCIAAMAPETQRQFLYDLCDAPPAASGPLPSAAERLELLQALAGADGVSPLGVELSELTIDGIRSQWLAAASRLKVTPSSAITAARALLESTCKTILSELQVKPDSSGDLSRLYVQTRQALQINVSSGTAQSVHQMLNGLVQVVNGLAGISNAGGDRHGLPAGARINDRAPAALAIHAAGTVSLFLAQVHKSRLRSEPAAV